MDGHSLGVSAIVANEKVICTTYIMKNGCSFKFIEVP